MRLQFFVTIEGEGNLGGILNLSEPQHACQCEWKIIPDERVSSSFLQQQFRVWPFAELRQQLLSSPETNFRIIQFAFISQIVVRRLQLFRKSSEQLPFRLLSEQLLRVLES